MKELKLIKLQNKDDVDRLPTFSKILGYQHYNGNMQVRDIGEIINYDFDMIDYYLVIESL